MTISVGEHLLRRLKEAGVEHVFGVPGDFNLGLLDKIVDDPDLTWVGTCNELNGAYAADGYARIKGMSALVTTFGVGELSAINGIAGAYAELAPLVNIVGMPATSAQKKHALLHHTLGQGGFTDYLDMYRYVTCRQVLLDESNAAREIDRAIYQCWLAKRPVYLGLPTDVVGKETGVTSLEPIAFEYPDSNPDAVKEILFRLDRHLQGTRQPVILADIKAKRHGMGPMIRQLAEESGIPVATLNMGKGIIDESHPLHLGMYTGELSEEPVREYVESSDAVICFGILLSDLNTGGFTTQYDLNQTIEIQDDHVVMGHSVYHNVYFKDVIPGMIEVFRNQSFSHEGTPRVEHAYSPSDRPLTQDRFWVRMRQVLERDCVVLAESGTSMLGTLPLRLPDGSDHICQPLWSSIGYTLGAALGTAIAAPKRQTVLFIGDGSFQLTAQEISTMVRHQLNPLIFVINNDGYTVERAIHGPDMPYNDIHMWRYADLPRVFGDQVWTAKAATETELETALEQQRTNPDKLRLIEVVMDKMDYPEMLAKIGRMCSEQNKY